MNSPIEPNSTEPSQWRTWVVIDDEPMVRKYLVMLTQETVSYIAGSGSPHCRLIFLPNDGNMQPSPFSQLSPDNGFVRKCPWPENHIHRSAT
jgi:hypothetical protein